MLHNENPLKLWSIVDEAALRRQVGGPDVMQAQLGTSLRLSELPNVTLQVIPFDAAHMRACRARSSSCSSPKRAIPDVIYIDSMAGDLFLEAEADVRRYRLVFEHLRAVAASPDASRVTGRGPRRGDVRREEVRHARAGPVPCPVAQEQLQQRQRPVRRGSPTWPGSSPSATPRTLTARNCSSQSLTGEPSSTA